MKSWAFRKKLKRKSEKNKFCDLMGNDSIDSCVIAVPLTNTYRGMTRSDAINDYKKMSTTDFEKQFETKDEVKFDRSEIIVNLDGNDKKIARIVAPFTRFDKWYGKDAKQSLMGSLIYTELDEFPIAEYCAIRNRNPKEIKIDVDTANYYRNSGWRAKIYYADGLVSLPSFTTTNQLLEVESSVLPEISKKLRKGFKEE